VPPDDNKHLLNVKCGRHVQMTSGKTGTVLMLFGIIGAVPGAICSWLAGG
jgi:hypothetical protein